MGDLAARILVVVILTALAVGVTLWLRRRAARSPIRVRQDRFGPGLYLFSSETCAACAEAREAIESALTPSGYTEIRWEDDPATFDEVGVIAVPSTLVVHEIGSGLLFPGAPGPALDALNP